MIFAGSPVANIRDVARKKTVTPLTGHNPFDFHCT